MKPILSRQVKRGEPLQEWISASEQNTLEGLRDFTRRQEERRRRIQGNNAQITELKRRLP